MNDLEILEKCMEFGRNLRFYRSKFLGLIPIINEKRLYKKRGFTSIFTFAFQVGGVSEEQVKAVLSLYFRFRDLSALKGLLINGAVSANKLIKVASIACKENEEELCSLLLKLPYKALETVVRDYKFSFSASDTNPGTNNQGGFILGSLSSKNMDNSNYSTLCPPVSSTPSLCPSSSGERLGPSLCPSSSGERLAPSLCPSSSCERLTPSLCPSSSGERLSPSSQTLQNVNKGSQIKISSPSFAHANAESCQKFLRAQKLFFALNEEVLARLNILLEKGHDLNEILNKLLDQREAQIQEKKQQISQNSQKMPAKSRHIPASVRRIVMEDKGTKCSHPNCTRPANTIHHTNRFALTKRHDPVFLSPLCKEHHQIAHFIDAKYQAKSTPP